MRQKIVGESNSPDKRITTLEDGTEIILHRDTNEVEIERPQTSAAEAAQRGFTDVDKYGPEHTKAKPNG